MAVPSRFTVGVCVHFAQNKGILGVNLELIRQAGVHSIRDEVYWSGVEREKGRLVMPEAWRAYVDEAVRQGIEPLLILDYGNPFYDKGDKPRSEEAVEAFTRYGEFVVRTFKGRVRRYEVWNEWDIGIGNTTPGTADDYVRLLKKVYPRLKAIDPGITILGGAMTAEAVRSGWLERMLQSGALPSCDAVSLHTYLYSRSPRMRTPEAWAGWMGDVQAMLRTYNRGGDVPVYITEMGWPTHIAKNGTSPQLSADYLARLYLLARTLPFMKGIWWYDFQDDGWNYAENEHNFGLVRPDGTPKPGYLALSTLGDLIAGAEYLGRVPAGDPDLWILRFRKSDGKDAWAIWSSHGDDGWQVTLRSGRKNPEPVLAQKAGSIGVRRSWGSRGWAEERRAPVRESDLELTVQGTPTLLIGGLPDVTVTQVKRREFPEAQRQQTL
jgi:hypothetical protein